MYLPHNKEHLCGICILLVSKHILYIVTKKLDEPLQLHEMMNYVFLQLIPLERRVALQRENHETELIYARVRAISAKLKGLNSITLFASRVFA